MRNVVALVSHDAGGAEVLSSWLKRQSIPCVVVAEGPARQIFLSNNSDSKFVG